MPIEKRMPAYGDKKGVGAGPYLAKVVSHLDPTFMGSLEVTLLRRMGNTIGDDNQTFVVRCASPFFGSTAFEYMGNNPKDYNDTQKSYGMWFVPPDLGVTVIVIFIDGNPAEGYWIACVPSRFANHMVPGIASSTAVDLSTEDRKKYEPSTRLPVAEVNRRANAQNTNTDIDMIKKAVHPLADRLQEEGLLDDDVRGSHNSSARRDIPSMVFGISTPGPLDKRQGAKRVTVGKKLTKSPTPVPVSRLGGTQMIFDDGDDQFQRKTPASQGPVQYADILRGEKGDPTIPYGESFRIRTRTGHQILLHNSEDLIYIGNAKGTTWIELTANGKIDIFAEDSISIHTQNDFNLKAARDVNIEAGRNVNIKATAEYEDPENLYKEKGIFDTANEEKGRVYIESVENFNLLIGRNGKIHVRNDEEIQGNLDIKVMGNMRISVKDQDVDPSFTNVDDKKIKAEQPEGVTGLHIRSFANTRITSDQKFELKTVGNNNFATAANTSILSTGQHLEQASVIHMNGPPAEVAAPAEISDKVLKLTVHANPLTAVESGWKERYQSGTTDSIMKRVPMHEPWLLHENQAPSVVSPQNTDREA